MYSMIQTIVMFNFLVSFTDSRLQYFPNDVNFKYSELLIHYKHKHVRLYQDVILRCRKCLTGLDN